MRPDAKLRRENLLRAAAQLFEEKGYDVPLETIAERAGIGRGTLYRNFSDRSQLALAVMRIGLDDLAQEIEKLGTDPDAFIPFLARVGVRSALHAASCEMALDVDMNREREAMVARAGELFAIPLRHAQAAGKIRPEVTVVDVHRIIKMLQAIATSTPSEARLETVDSALKLLVRGIGIDGTLF